MTKRFVSVAVLLLTGLSLCGQATAATVEITTNTTTALDVKVLGLNLFDAWNSGGSLGNWGFNVFTAGDGGTVGLSVGEHRTPPPGHGERSPGWQFNFVGGMPAPGGIVSSGPTVLNHPLSSGEPGPDFDTWTFTAVRAGGPGLTVDIGVQASHGSDGGGGAGVPEPATFGLLVCALSTAAAVRLRRVR